MKSVAIFALTCLSAAMLTACGGGGGGGISLRPQPMPGDTLGGGVVVSSTVNRDAVANQLNRLNGNRMGVTDPNSDLLMSQSDNGTVSFRTIRNSANYLSAPAIAIYTVSAGATAAVVDSVMTFGSLLGTSQALMVGGSMVTVGLEDDDHLRLGSIAITASSGFRVRAFESSVSAPPSTSQSGASPLGVSPPDTLETGGSMMGISRYTYFLDGQYAALCLGFDVLNPLVYTWGGSIPTPSTSRTSTSGDLTYNIPYAMGAYTDGMNDQRFLNGSGTLSANLGSSGGVTLNLDVVDHNGSMFLDVDNLAMTLHSDRSGFRCSNSGCAGSIDYADGVDLPDNTSAGFDSNGSFYGPNGQEVVGLISHIASSTVRMQLGFIGRDETAPGTPTPPAPPGPPGVGIPTPIPNPGSPIPIPSVGDVSPLMNIYTVNSGVTSINRDALFNYYSTLNTGARVDDANRQFLANFLVDSSTQMPTEDYAIVQNPMTVRAASGLVNPPTGITYEVEGGGTVASVVAAFTPGRQFIVGETLLLTLGTTTLSISGSATALSVNGSLFIDLGSGRGYTGSGHQPSQAGALSESYAFFLQAEYSALYMVVDRSPDVGDGLGNAFNYGVLTPNSEIPTSGNVTYNIDHVIGTYEDQGNHANGRLLSGSGTLVADFTSGNRMVTLNLDVNDHTGADFLDVMNLQMQIAPNRNEFYCGGFYDGNDCTGTFDYKQSGSSANGMLIDQKTASGSFYGPNAAEVAGRIHHRRHDGGVVGVNHDRTLDLGFIGKRAVPLGPTTSDIPAGSAAPATE